MDRKKTILMAALVNAGLLTILFITALSSEDEVVLGQLAEREVPQATLSPTPTKGMAPLEIPPAKEVPALVVEAPPAPESPIVHKLPPPTPAFAVEAEKKTPVEKTHQEVVVKKGDSLDKIAKMHHTTVDEIIRLNQLPGSFLKIGQVLKLPLEKGSPPVSKSEVRSEKVASKRPEYYTIMVGDNPWGIAIKHHMKLEELLRLNQLNEEKARKLKPGDRLRIR